MTLSWHPQEDFLDVADGQEAVTLTGTSGASTAVSHALRRRITEEEAATSGGRYSRRDVRWHLPIAQVPTPPQLGETIADGSGQVWVILQVDHDTRSSRWRCGCRRLVLAATLNDRVTLQQAARSKDVHGGLLTAWSDWKTDLPARIQAVDTQIAVRHGQRVAREVSRVFLAQAESLTQNHRILHPASGRVYHILGWEGAERIDALFTISAASLP